MASSSWSNKVEGKRVQEDLFGGSQTLSWPPPYDMGEAKPISDQLIHYKVGKTDRWQLPGSSQVIVYDPENATPTYGCMTVSCGPSCFDTEPISEPSSVLDMKKRCFSSIPGCLTPPSMWPFVDEITAKASEDDKTILVTGISREMTDQTDFLKLFHPFGQVSCAKLALVYDDFDGRLIGNGRFGYVTFLNKEDAQQAIATLNGSPHGRDRSILALYWASTLNKST